MRTLTRLTPYLLAAGAMLGAACGDDGGGNNKADAAPTSADASVDAPPPPPAHTGTIAITDVKLTTPGADQGATGAGIRGGAVSIAFENPGAAGGGERVFGTTNINGCVVVKYTKANPERPATDEGVVTISGAGLHKPLGTCSYNKDATPTPGYECVVDSGTDKIVATRIAGTVYAVVLTKDFTTTDLVGSYVRLSGFKDDGDAATDGIQTFNGTFPVVKKVVDDATKATTLTVVISAPAPATETVDAGKFTFLGGFQPIPTHFPPALGIGAIDADLFNAAGTVNAKKAAAASPGIPAFDSTLTPAGDTFTIPEAGVQAHEFPFTSADVTFTCGASCGSEPAGTQAIVLSGRTTDVAKTELAKLPKFAMPAASSATTYATFQCSFFKANGAYTATLPKAAVDAILATSPTRIETRVFRMSAIPGTPNVLVVHGEVGHSDAP